MKLSCSTEPGKKPDDIHAIVLALLEWQHHINGNMIHCGLHIDINKKELTPLNHSELNSYEQNTVN